jgi:hypothetical protein
MGHVLNAGQRRHLDAAVQQARTASEKAAADALHALAVAEPSRPAYLSDDDNTLRLALREKARQLGDDTARTGASLTNLVREVAYEQWHRLLFARFLEVNGLLRHPEFRDTSLTLEDCEDLADELGEPDGWSVAARFASEILPGVFRLDDPAVQVRFATEHRLELERILLSIFKEVFLTEDALGWVYQFWQTAEKKRVKESGVKIGGTDLSPVTQLFTENYMVRFLLENSLGAWWAGRHPDSPLVKSWEHLRRLDDGAPVAGTFSDWPESVAEVRVMDPCCGSGHFLVAMFGMLWRMRAEEEDLSPADAQDAVLRENLHGLELDPRCTQIATFNVALEAWKQGGFRDLPAPRIACSGVPIRATRTEWEELAGEDDELRKVLGRLHSLFLNADTLGSLIDPRPSNVGNGIFGRDLSIGVDWEMVRGLVKQALTVERHAESVLGHAADDVVHAAGLLGRTYVLVATNPPFLGKRDQDELLVSHLAEEFPEGNYDLATAFLLRCLRFSGESGTSALVLPRNWMTQATYRSLRKYLLASHRVGTLARLGERAFSSSAAAGAFPALLVVDGAGRSDDIPYIDAALNSSAAAIERDLMEEPLDFVDVSAALKTKDVHLAPSNAHSLTLASFARPFQGIATGDDPRFKRYFWEQSRKADRWTRIQGSVDATTNFGGRSQVVDWSGGSSAMAVSDGARIQGRPAWGKRGVVISQMRSLPATFYEGDMFDINVCPIIPNDPDDLDALWQYVLSGEYATAVRKIESSIKVTTKTLAAVPFDPERWRGVAGDAGPLPQPHSDDPTQWLFKGDVLSSPQPLQVAVARLLGYRWPEQQADNLDRYADGDGIAALQSLPGEADLATRLRELLDTAYGDQWSSSLERTLVTEAGGQNGRLEDWLRDGFFAQHVKVFGNRPFLWHIWDGRKDGFSAVVNYHRLDHRTLEKLTFTSLGAWIERQKHEAAAGRAGADARLAAAEDLQARLKFVLDGAPPYDVYVRWKELHEQPIGWSPDLDDGVRLNIRPFVAAGVLRSKVNVQWKKDRGTNSDGSERVNDLHPSLEERRAARRLAGVKL